jgi:hypothetical protein
MMMINSLSSIEINGLSDFGNSTKKSTKSGTFADAFQSVSQQLKEKQDVIQLSAQDTGNSAAITDSGKKSTGGNSLTEVQKQYLRDKYHLSDSSGLSETELDHLLTDLTNEGALSYQDYRLAGACPTTPEGVAVVSTQKPTGELLSSSGNYGEFFGQVVQGEKSDADYIREKYGIEAPSAYHDCIEAHQRIENLLNSLLE